MLKKLLLTALITITVSSCASTQVAQTKKQLLVQTRMNDSIFLEPVAPNKQVIYIRVRNTSGNSMLNLDRPIRNKIEDLGFKITRNPDEANFMLLANVKNYTENRTASDGTGESLVGAIAGGVLGSAIGGGKGQEISATAGALAGGYAGQTFSNKTLDITFTAVVDLQISERAASGEIINYNAYQNKKQGMDTKITSNFTNKSPWKKYSTLMISKANKANLTSAEATPAIINDITNALAGIF